MPTTAWRDEDVPPSAAAWLVDAQGRAWLAEALAVTEGADELAVATRLRTAGLTPEQAATVQAVATASLRAWRAGQPSGTWWTPSAGEQASQPLVGRWRARRFAGARAVDLTAGCGGDALAMAAHADELVAGEVSWSRLPLLRANLDGAADVVAADATCPCVDVAATDAFADPGRRVGGRRVRSLGQTVPPVPVLAEAGWRGLGVAVSPGLDLEDPDRPADAELEFVQVDRQLVEATLWTGRLRDAGPGPRAQVSATLLPEGMHRRGVPSPPGAVADEVGAWLALPAPALVRARLVDEVADELGLARVAARRALFTGPTAVASPWFTCERVEAVVAARPLRVRDALRGMDEQPLEIVTHGMDVDVTGWWKRLGGVTRGPQGRALHLVRMDRGAAAVLTQR